MRKSRKIFLVIFCCIALLLLALKSILSYWADDVIRNAISGFSDKQYDARIEKVKFTFIPLGIQVERFSLLPDDPSDKILKADCEFLRLELASVTDFILFRQLKVTELRAVKPSIAVKVVNRENTNRKDVATTIGEIREKLFSIFQSLQAEKVALMDADVKVITGDSKEDYFYINKITLELSGLDLEKDETGNSTGSLSNARLILNHPEIHLADSDISVRIGYLSEDRSKQEFRIDSIVLENRSANSGLERLELTSVRAKRLNWERFLREGFFELDSAHVVNGRVALNFTEKKNRSRSRSTSDSTYSGSSFLIHHISVSDISYSVKLRSYIRKGDDNITMNLKGDSLVLKELALLPDRKPAISVGQLMVHITNFSETDEKSLYSASLGKIRINEKRLELNDYRLAPRQGINTTYNNRISVSGLTLEGYSLEDLLMKRLNAEQLVIDRPEIVLDLPQEKGTGKAERRNFNESLRKSLGGITEKVNVGKVVLNNASLRLRPVREDQKELKIEGLSVQLDGKRLSKAGSLDELLQSVDRFNTSTFRMQGKDMELFVEGVTQKQSPTGFLFQHVHGHLPNGIILDLNNVNYQLSRQRNTGPSLFHAAVLTVESGNVIVKSGSKRKTTEKKAAISVNTDFLDLRNLVFTFQKEDQFTASAVLDIEAENFRMSGRSATWKTLSVKSAKNKFESEKTTFEAGQLRILQPGTIEMVRAKGKTRKDQMEIDFSAEELVIHAGVDNTDLRSLKISGLHMKQPELNIIVKKKPAGSEPLKKQGKAFARTFAIDSLTLEQPSVSIRIADENGRQITNSKSLKGTFYCTGLVVESRDGKPLFRASTANYEAINPELHFAGTSFHPSSISVDARDFYMSPSNHETRLFIRSMTVNDLHTSAPGKKNDSLMMRVKSFTVYDYHYHSGKKHSWKQLIGQHRWESNGVELEQRSEKQSVHVYGLNASHDKTYHFTIDSLKLRPHQSRERFWADEPYEKDYMVLSTGKITGNHVMVNLEASKPEIEIGHLDLLQPYIRPERDKTRPEDTVLYRPLLAQQILKIPLRLKVDTLEIRNGYVEYHEIGKKSGKEGRIFLDQINGYVFNVKTHGILPEDSIRMRLTTRLFGEGFLRLLFRQSYADTLQGFWMRTRMNGFSMNRMNELLSPLLGVSLRSGHIDTLTMLVKGNDHFAYGTMDMRYDNLNVWISNSDEEEGTFISGPISWIANQLLRRHDNGRPDLLFRKRVRKRGQFNFWGKIAVEGLLTNIGVKRDNAEKRDFKKNIKAYHLPENYWTEE